VPQPSFVNDAFINLLPDGILTLDHDSRIIDLNRAALSILGLPCSAAGKNSSDFEQTTALLNAIRDHKKEIQIISDPQQWIEVSTQPGAAGQIIVIRDISERKRLELALREAEVRFQKIEQAHHQASMIAKALQAVSMAINSTLDFTQVLNVALEQIYKVIPYDTASILLRDGEDIVIVALRNFKEPEQVRDQRFSLTRESPNRLVLEKHRPVRVENVQNDFPTFGKTSFSQPIQSWLGIPIFSGEEIIGFINLDSIEPDHFNEQDEQSAEAFANQVSTALENSRLFSEAQRQIKEKTIINEIMETISITMNLKDLLEMVYQQINKFIDTNQFIVATFEEEKQEWRVVYSRRNGELEDSAAYKVTDGFSGYAIQQRETLFLKNLAEVKDFTRRTGRLNLLSEPHSAIFVPLIVSDKVVGVMGTQNNQKDDAYSQADFSLFYSISTQISMAIENARLFARMETMAITDILTGIYNRRHFFALAEKEFARAFRYHTDLSIIMLDIDHFKRVNDDFGHRSGDQVLQILAKNCSAVLRKPDIFGRYGGEEFAILLPETNSNDASIVAERIRRTIEEIEISSSKGMIHITASLGLAGITEPCSTSVEALLDCADQALYVAKQSGRNRVHIFSQTLID
jgi:diguanylate cyclase (GGDEF)-like protein